LRKEFTEFDFDYHQYFVGGGFDIRALGFIGWPKKHLYIRNFIGKSFRKNECKKILNFREH
jgi:hypothetical protein